MDSMTDVKLNNKIVIEKSVEERIERQRIDDLSELNNKLPEGAEVDINGVPTYLGLSGSKLTWALTVVASLGFTLFGYDQGVMSGLISAPVFFETFPAVDPAHQNQGASKAALQQAFYVAIYEIGCLVGALFALGYGDKLGRRRMIMTGSWVMLIGVLIQVTAFAGHHSGTQFIIGRIVTGLGNGANTATIPTWHAETSKSHNRGLLVCIEASTIAFGTAIAYWIDFAFSTNTTSVSWRIPIAIQCIFAFLLLIGVHYLPESPRWLIGNGQLAEGQRVVAALEPAPFNSEEAQVATRVILESLEGNQEIRKSDVLTSGRTQHLRRMLIGASSQIMQQIGGANAVIYFAPVIFNQTLGLDRQLSLILGGVNVTVYALASLISLPMIERIGRRKMFLAGTVGQAASMFIIMGCLIPGTPEVAKGAVFGLFLYLIFFGSTWLQLPWLYPAEINPLRTRTNANAISTINNWVFNFAVVLITPPLLESINWGTFLLFGAINICFLPPIYYFYPETSGRSLEEIDVIFGLAYVEKRSYVEVARNMPFLTYSEVESEVQRLGLGQNIDEETSENSGRSTPTVVSTPTPAEKI